MSYSVIDINDPLRSKKLIVFDTFRALIESNEVKSCPASIMSCLSKVNRKLQSDGADFTVLSVILPVNAPDSVSLGKAYGQFSDGTKWDFKFSDIMLSH